MGSSAQIPVTIRGVEYPSTKAAAKALNLTISAIHVAKRQGRLDTVGLKKQGSDKAKPVTIRSMAFASRAEACRELGVSSDDLGGYFRVLERAEKVYQSRWKAKNRPSPEAIPQRDPYLPPLGKMVFSEDGTKVQCHVCGQWLGTLNTHLRQHGLDARSYKEAYDLPRTISMWPPSTKSKQRSAALDRGQGEIGKRHLPPPTGRLQGIESRLGTRIAASEQRKGIYTRGGNKTRGHDDPDH